MAFGGPVVAELDRGPIIHPMASAAPGRGARKLPAGMTVCTSEFTMPTDERKTSVVHILPQGGVGCDHRMDGLVEGRNGAVLSPKQAGQKVFCLIQ